jgi:hypothetical protein
MNRHPDDRIYFADNGPWGAYSQRDMARWATLDHKGSLAVRVLFAALGRHGRTGHAPFGVGELARILGSADRDTGRLAPARKDTVSKAIGAAKRQDYVTSESNARCLVLSQAIFQRASGAKTPCRVHPPD